MSSRPALSIIIPMLNEASGLLDILSPLQALRQRGNEVIVVDGGSADTSVALAGPLADTVLSAPRGRAVQMNAGAAAASGQVLLFLHADTRLPAGAEVLIQQAVAQGRQWGRFDVCIEGRPRMLRIVSGLMNLRSRLTGIATGDQAIFVTRQAFERVGGFPLQPLMEDLEMSRRLKRLGHPACLRERVRTSGRRWEERGVWRTIFLMWRLRWRYWRGEPAAQIAEAYR